MNIVVTNMAEIEAGLREALRSYAEQVTAAAALGVTETARLVLDDSNGLAPFVTGALIESGHADEAAVIGSSAVAEVGYSVPYAAMAHEDMQGRHPKFLEKAVMGVGPEMRNIVLKAIA